MDSNALQLSFKVGDNVAHLKSNHTGNVIKVYNINNGHPSLSVWLADIRLLDAGVLYCVPLEQLIKIR